MLYFPSFSPAQNTSAHSPSQLRPLVVSDPLPDLHIYKWLVGTEAIPESKCNKNESCQTDTE